MKINITTIIALSFAINSFGQCLGTEEESKKYFMDRITSIDPIEGIWSISANTKNYDSYNRQTNNYNDQQGHKRAIYRSNSEFNSCLISANNNFANVSFNTTAVKGVYLFKIYYPATSSTINGNATLNNIGILEYSYEMPTVVLKRMMGTDYENGMRSIITATCIKIFPTEVNYKETQIASGTGFALTSDGVIVTNHHVVNGATTIKVRGVKGDFTKLYNAIVITEDKKNDLAIIKIDDINFIGLGSIPFLINGKSSDVGTSVFVMGYPLRASMGDEIKLTNGIISSKSGFQGDVTSYQITAPIQPGNSGGPLFDSNGNLIGIVNAKHTRAENVSYAIKSTYLLNLFDLMPTAPNLQTISSVIGKNLTEQVKTLKKFIYIIEVN